MINVRGVHDLNVSIVAGLHRLNRDKFDAVVGIPRSGMIAASLLATHLQKPLADVEGFCSGLVYKRFHSKLITVPRIMILDDTINKGESMAWAVSTVRRVRPAVRIIRAAVWRASYTPDELCDFVFDTCPSPRAFAWNMWKHVRMPRWCFDMDGVLCRDPESVENDDGVRYLNFINTAEPKFIPQRPIGHVVTCRLEKYRGVTEAWLKRHKIEFISLTMMQHDTKAERMAAGGRAAWKAEVYQRLGTELFIESNPGQAGKIAEMTKLPVWCTTTQVFHSGVTP